MEWYPLKGDGHALWGRAFFGVARLDAELAARADALWRTEGGRRWIALPWQCGKEFPLTELFCFAHMRTVQGRECVVYCVDAEGFPIVPSFVCE